MILCILLLMVLSIAYGIQFGAPPTEGTLNCQCTCTPRANPSKTLYTSGNMNIVDTTFPQVKDDIIKQKIDTNLRPVPKVEGTQFPINKEITSFQDVAVSKVRNSLASGSTGPVVEGQGSINNHTKFQWLHSASTTDQSEANQGSLIIDNSTVDMSVAGLGGTGSLTGGKSTILGEDIVDKPQLSLTSKTHKPTQVVIETSTSDPGNNDDITVDITDGSNQPTTAATDFHRPDIVTDRPMKSFAETSHRTADTVASDIGFVLEGSAPKLIISGVLSGMRDSSTGTGYIVENINSNSQNSQLSGHFVSRKIDSNLHTNKELQTAGKNSPSTPQVNNSPSPTQSTVTTYITKQSAPQKTVTSENVKISMNIDTHFNKTKQGTMTINDNKQTQNKNQQLTQKNRVESRNNNENSRDTNVGQPNGNAQRNNIWQNKNQQNNGGNTRNNNRPSWQPEQMKPFQIQRDQKLQGMWSNNNNEQWGHHNNWGTTPNPVTNPFGMIGMDPLLFLGQHHF